METPEFFQGSSGYYHINTTPEKLRSDSKTDHFVVDDLLDFPTDDVGVEGSAYGNALTGTSTDSSTAVDSCNSSSVCGGADPTFPGDVGSGSFVDTQFSSLCVPDDLSEFEWLSNFVEESFSHEDLQKLQLISGLKPQSKHASEPPNRTNNSIFTTVPSKARTKRSRAAPCNWTSRLLVISPTLTGSLAILSSSESESSSIGKKNVKTPLKMKEFHDNEDGRKCLHCATDKTPQWRTGPMGPKTLCNACGVRYKSGRLVPEYRPAASPTFILTRHSNSHRKVLELIKEAKRDTKNTIPSSTTSSQS